MSTPRLFESLRARGEPVPLVDLARHLLALRDPPPPRVARRVVAAALRQSAETLLDPLPCERLDPRPAVADDATPLEVAEFAVVDLETTGFSPERASILEIGAVCVSRLAIADRFATLVRPGRPIPPKIVALTGIDDAMVARAPAPSEALLRFRAWLDRTPEAAFVAHNAPFDESFLRRGLAEHGLPPLGRVVLCTRRLARRIVPEIGGFGLDRLTAALGIQNRARHRALGDAEATAHALIELLRRARCELEVATLGELRALQERRRGGRGSAQGGHAPADPQAGRGPSS